LSEWEFREWPPNIQWHNDNNAREVIIYCDSTDFDTDGLLWAHEEGDQYIEVEGRKVGDGWTLCEEMIEATQFFSAGSLLEGLQLCDILDITSPGEPKIEDRGTYDAVNNGLRKPGRRELDYGASFNFRAGRVLSRLLLHEMLHYSGRGYSQYCIS
jgi:hypothetical protein